MVLVCFKAVPEVRMIGQVEGITALNCVAWAGDRALAKLLLDSQAEPHANAMGESPEEMARNSDQKHLLPLRLDLYRYMHIPGGPFKFTCSCTLCIPARPTGFCTESIHRTPLAPVVHLIEHGVCTATRRG